MSYPVLARLLGGSLLCLTILAGAQPLSQQALTIDNQLFQNRYEYYRSQYFQDTGRRCGLPDKATRLARSPLLPKAGVPADCTENFTNPSADYDPVVVYEITVVVHIIQHNDGRGALTDAQVHSQIAILNEDYQALPGTPGSLGHPVAVRFVLASTDPQGNPTTGITRTTNNTWFNDNGNYWDSLAWDPQRYLNIYTNSADGNLGYVPFLPMEGPAGTSEDRVVILWEAFGRNSPGGPPYDQGRTTTHEVGHYLGLEHPFGLGLTCPTNSNPPACYGNGDYLCDTPAQRRPQYGCPTERSSCGSTNLTDNYMDYVDDTCMTSFTVEQVRRMRCALEHYRPTLYRADTLFSDGFED